MQIAAQTDPGVRRSVIPKLMRAAVYHGQQDVRLETVPVPEIERGEILVRVHTCGICGTDLKKIATGSHSAPRIFGHETAGQVVATGEGVENFSIGDRVMIFHHIPCRECYYCRHRVFAQCPVYKKVGATAGFEPSGGGFAEYVRVMDWIVRDGVVKLPHHVSYEQASFVEPVNTCMKAIESIDVKSGETLLVIGQGPIGLILAILAKRAGAQVVTSDLYPQRLKIGATYGLRQNVNSACEDPAKVVREMTGGRGADIVILAVAANSLVRTAMDAARPGGKIMLFAQTQRSEVSIDPASICVDEKVLLGSYSASVDLQEENVRLVFGGEVDFAGLITHRFSLEQAVDALELAAHPVAESMKIVIQPGMQWETA
jgi:L-iditol 2-dehydrogenase